ncbi:outer membrane beta-barrel domain protein, partial [Vibrio parahaemolyticus V-223/04]
QRRRVRV